MILGEIYDVAEAKGREAERAAILVHLSNMAANWNGAVGTAALEMAVRQIERGDHLPGGGE